MNQEKLTVRPESELLEKERSKNDTRFAGLSASQFISLWDERVNSVWLWHANLKGGNVDARVM